MGKKSKKTRWRTLALNGHQSDSEESNTPSLLHQNQRNYHNRYYNSKFTYSSQSTPIRKYQNESSKTTRSNSTTSEHKTTFNEDEYTRITTPRQDVLFKKGYLNKPKTYQTQTSTGTSSTANSTSTCTPDHQSADGTEGTDLEYESQFVFPNGFIDQNGIYYINSYEPFPFVVYNAPICYPEFPGERTKRYSTDSATESASPQNEEVVQNGVTKPADYYNATTSDNSNEEPRRLKKKRRRKISRAKEEGDTSCDTDASDIVFEEPEPPQTSPTANHLLEDTPQVIQNGEEEPKTSDNDSQKTDEDSCNKYPLKPDAEEFIPRTFQVPPEVPFEPNNVQFVNFAPGFIPVPYLNHNPTFLPPGIPINYVPIQEPKFVNVIVSSATETKEPTETVEAIQEATTQTEQCPPKKASIDIDQIVSKLEAVEEQNRENKKDPVQHIQSIGPVRRGRYQFQKGYRAKLVEKPRALQTVVTQIPANNRIPKVAAEKQNKPCARYEKALEPVIKQVKPANQWISVASRKKKRKGVNEQQDDFEDDKEEEKTQNDDLFESFDVNLLEDVVPPSKLSNNVEATPVVAVIQSEVIEPVGPQQETAPLEPLEVKVVETPIKNKEQKKKTKRVVQKTAAKRIIITDDLSNNEEAKITELEEAKPETKNEVIKEPEAKPVDDQTPSETIEKKKKKKKKVVKPLQSISSSTTTLSNLDDSYDFLLENAIMEDSDQKTNVEMSHAFDLMIQKGMYNSLEEKIKALRIGASEDGFFKTINFGTLTTPPTPSKQIFASSQFDKLFQNEALKNELESKPLSKSNSAIFLENPTVNEIIKNVVDPSEDRTEYPITQAVKNWLTKTRENTPDVELLKSPNTIYKELCEGPVEKQDDEVTLWSVSPQISQEEDLLDCWESELPVTKTSSQTEINGLHNGHIEEGEDVIEVYESKYGKNEDYLRLKAEVEEQQKTSRNFPRHGNLPYRAICCNIM